MTENEKKLLNIVDMHTAGEPVRIIDARHLDLGGSGLLNTRSRFQERFDHIRRSAMMEPRGHADMYGVVLVRPTSPSSDAGAIFIHNSGYSSMCGHVTIALGRYLSDQGRPRSGNAFRLECPCGDVAVRREGTEGKGPSVFQNVPGKVVLERVVASTSRKDRVEFDVAYGGAYYAVLPARELGVRFGHESIETMRHLLTEFVASARAAIDLSPFDEPQLAHLYGGILTEDDPLRSDAANRHLCWFGEGQIDRSPTGSGVTARLALAAKRNQAAPEVLYRFAGASGLEFGGRITGFEGDEVLTEIEGQSYYTGRQTFVLEADDPVVHGFFPGEHPTEI